MGLPAESGTGAEVLHVDWERRRLTGRTRQALDAAAPESEREPVLYHLGDFEKFGVAREQIEGMLDGYTSPLVGLGKDWRTTRIDHMETAAFERCAHLMVVCGYFDQVGRPEAAGPWLSEDRFDDLDAFALLSTGEKDDFNEVVVKAYEETHPPLTALP